MDVGLAVFQRRLQYFPDRHLVDPAQAWCNFFGMEILIELTPFHL
jgi:hypothetical protein